MKARSWISITAALLGLLLAAGCSTPESRIRQNPEAFNRLRPEQQEQIRKGQVAIGFDVDMVKLAVGDPDYVRERTDASGRTEVWGYTEWESYDGMMLYTGYYHRGFYGRGRHRGGFGGGGMWDVPYYYPYFDAFPNRRPHDYLRLTFRDGKVIAIDRDLKR